MIIVPKRKYYVSLSNKKILPVPVDASSEFEVEIDRTFVSVFERLFKQMDDLEMRNFLRAHLPYIPYHNDKNNHDIDLRTQKIYAMIHEFSDPSTQRFIEQLPYFR